MAVYISVRTDPFASSRARAQNDWAQVGAAVRRPMRGLVLKEESYAMIRVKRADGSDVELFDSGASQWDQTDVGRTTMYANFLLQSVREARVEKQQIVETFGEDYVYFFGERPRMLDINGVLINSANFDWKAEFWANYDRFFRGTKLVEQNARVYFYFDDTVVEGYFTGASTVASTDSPQLMPLNFQLFVTNYHQVGQPGLTLVHSRWGRDRSAESLVAVPPSAKASPAVAAKQGGLLGFLAAAAQLKADATFSIQETVENIRNTLYGRRLTLPTGIQAMIAPTLVDNVDFATPKIPGTNRYTYNVDEYVVGGTSPTAGLANLATNELLIQAQLEANDPAALEAKARAVFKANGISTEEPSAQMALLGRGAFAAAQFIAPFALKSIDGGRLGQVDQGIASTSALI